MRYIGYVVKKFLRADVVDITYATLNFFRNPEDSGP
jgi:hypothetical protein